MPPNMQRYLPIMLVVLLAVFVVPSLLKKKTSTGASAKTLAAQAIDAATVIDRAEEAYRQLHGRFAAHLADLLPTHPRLAADLVGGVSVTLDASTDGRTYLQQISDQYLSLVRSRNGAQLVANSCLVLKSASGVACPAQ